MIARIGGLRIGFCDFAISRHRTRSIPTVVEGFGICAKDRADLTPCELGEPKSRPFLDPGSSSYERLKR
eukprot:12919094-Alexandrium_andersonii.AAC.1